MEKKNESNSDIRLKGQLKNYMQWPLYMDVLLIIVSIFCCVLDMRRGLLILMLVLIYTAILSIFYIFNQPLIMKDLMEFASEYGDVQKTVLKELTFPYALIMEDGRIVWMNKQFEEVLQKKNTGDVYLDKYLPQINSTVFPEEADQTTQIEIAFGEKEYSAEMHRLSIENYTKSDHMIELPENADSFIAVCLRDITELKAYIRENENQRLIAGLVYLDNYDEVLDSVDEVKQALLFALVDRKINQYISDACGIVKKLENDKYFFVVQKQYFEKMKEDKFSLLEAVKSVNMGNSIPVTLSIGMGFHRENYSVASGYARAAIDLALARGGDQAVIKDSTDITYYGGKQEQTAKNTRVKARVKAQALRELLNVNREVFVMGHKLPDSDAFGAAIGIYRAATVLGKKAHVIVNEVSASLRPLYNAYKENLDYPADLIITSEEALEMVSDDSMVIVVDTNRPQMLESEELLKKVSTVVVLDHHRQSSDNIPNTVLSYVEPYASSASEMVAEILQYIDDGIKLPKLEASSLYAGIMIDTNYFVNKTGVRTFEAAAYLRRCGADLALVRKLFRDDMDAYRAKASIISNAEIYKGKIAIAAGVDLNVESPTIIGAQAANELLDINGIKASFILTEYHDKIFVSARSIDDINVQVMMEKLGGGGHMNAAGAQFDHTNMDKAVIEVKELIDRYVKGDE